MTRAISEEMTVVAPVPEAAKRPKAERVAHLIVLCGHNVGQVFGLNKPRIQIGREEGADIQIMDAGISRHHAVITRTEDGGYLLQDAGSRNGTFANNRRVEDMHRLNDGDRVQVGVMTVLKFAYADDPESNYAKAMYDAANRDGLTGLANRRYFEEHLLAEFPYAVRNGRPLALLMLDLDHFKQVNDTHGHPVGDSVLKELAQLMTRNVRGDDIVGRYGGEEFAILCRQTDRVKASILGERIRHEVANAVFVPDTHRLKLSISIGIAALPDPALTDPQSFVAAADAALYQAKQRGRNCVVALQGK